MAIYSLAVTLSFKKQECLSTTVLMKLQVVYLSLVTCDLYFKCNFTLRRVFLFVLFWQKERPHLKDGKWLWMWEEESQTRWLRRKEIRRWWGVHEVDSRKKRRASLSLSTESGRKSLHQLWDQLIRPWHWRSRSDPRTGQRWSQWMRRFIECPRAMQWCPTPTLPYHPLPDISVHHLSINYCIRATLCRFSTKILERHFFPLNSSLSLNGGKWHFNHGLELFLLSTKNTPQFTATFDILTTSWHRFQAGNHLFSLVLWGSCCIGVPFLLSPVCK